MRSFEDRREAGRTIAAELTRFAGRDDVVVLGLPRGGVPVASEVARALLAPLDVFIVRKLGVPWQPELAMGAIASGGVQVVNDDVVAGLRIESSTIEAVARAEAREIQRQEALYREGRGHARLRGRIVILVDDGLATGSTMRAAVVAARRHDPASLVVAVPVAPPAAVHELALIADLVICPYQPEPFWGVGAWYHDFSPTSDEEVRRLLRDSPVSAASPRHADAPPGPGATPH